MLPTIGLLILYITVLFSNAIKLEIGDGNRIEWVREHDIVTVWCRLTESPRSKVKITWLFPNETEISSDGDIMKKVTKNFAFLIIKKSQLNDSGNYTCIANYEKNSTTGTINGSVEIKVFEQFDWLDCEANQYLKLGASNQKLICVVPDIYNDFVVWTKNGTQLPESRYNVNKSLLVVDGAVGVDNVGVYTMTVFNPELKVNKSRDINVKLLASPKIIFPNVNYVRVEMSSPQIQCDASGTPTPIFDWFDKNGHNMTMKTGNYKVNRVTGTLNFINLTITSGKLFTCVAENAEGRDNRTFNVTLYEKPVIVRFVNTKAIIGHMASIDCHASGIPLQSIRIGRIFREDENIIHDKLHVKEGSLSASFLISNVTRDDEGLYYCNVTNGFESDLKKVTLSVEYPPKITIREQEIELCSNMVRLVCIIDSKPIGNVMWKKDGQTIFTNRTYAVTNFTKVYVLTINDIRQRNISGEYTCIASNKHGTNSSSILVRAKKASPLQNIEITELTTTSIKLSIQRQVNSCVEVHNVNLRLQKSDSIEVIWSRSLNMTSNSEMVVDRLKPDTEYVIAAVSGDEIEEGSYSEIQLKVKTKKYSPESSPSLTIVIYVSVTILIVLVVISLFGCCYLVYTTVINNVSNTPEEESNVGKTETNDQPEPFNSCVEIDYVNVRL